MTGNHTPFNKEKITDHNPQNINGYLSPQHAYPHQIIKITSLILIIISLIYFPIYLSASNVMISLLFNPFLAKLLIGADLIFLFLTARIIVREQHQKNPIKILNTWAENLKPKNKQNGVNKNKTAYLVLNKLNTWAEKLKPKNKQNGVNKNKTAYLVANQNQDTNTDNHQQYHVKPSSKGGSNQPKNTHHLNDKKNIGDNHTLESSLQQYPQPLSSEELKTRTSINEETSDHHKDKKKGWHLVNSVFKRSKKRKKAKNPKHTKNKTRTGAQDPIG